MGRFGFLLLPHSPLVIANAIKSQLRKYKSEYVYLYIQKAMSLERNVVIMNTQYITNTKVKH